MSEKARLAETMRVALGQMAVAQRQPERNLHKAAELASRAAAQGAKLLLLPEMWTTGFHWEWNAEHASEQPAVVEAAAKIAQEHGIWMAGSMLTPNKSEPPSNTMTVFSPEGKVVATYAKVHLFGPFQEQRNITPGASLTVWNSPWGAAGLSVCYDLRFPELFRSYALKGVRFQLLSAAFPHPRLEHWRILLRARAIENQMFVIAVNQVGTEVFTDESSATYFGSSCVIDPWGRVLCEGSETDEELLMNEMDLAECENIRSKLNVLADRRPDVYL